MKALNLILTIFVMLYLGAARAQILVEDGQGESVMQQATPEPQKRTTTSERGPVGEKAAREYFIIRKERSTAVAGRSPNSVSSGARYMALQVGTMISDKQYRWGRRDRDEDVGDFIFNVSYRVGEWTNSMDLLLRVEYGSYSIDKEDPRKLSFMPVVTFPDVKSEFPLYFGAGLGLGVFLDQVANESDLSFDYKILAGGRFLGLFENGGLVLETGMRGHVHLLSSGQYNGVFLTAGAGFTF